MLDFCMYGYNTVILFLWYKSSENIDLSTTNNYNMMYCLDIE